jgi:hypothetical protein
MITQQGGDAVRSHWAPSPHPSSLPPALGRREGVGLIIRRTSHAAVRFSSGGSGSFPVMFRPPIHEMTQVQRRTFIPNMLKVFTGCGKPGWGKEEMKPVWWPDDIPWQNMKRTVGSAKVKAHVSCDHTEDGENFLRRCQSIWSSCGPSQGG